jgi:hypothetical protein
VIEIRHLARRSAPALAVAVGFAILADHPGDDAAGQIGDSAGPLIGELVHGHIGAGLAHQPVMGLTSILARLPFALAARAAGGGEGLSYRLGVLACVLAAGFLLTFVVGAAVARGRSWIGAGAIALLALVNPLSANAVWWGHPEELLGAALCVAAVLAAIEDRRACAGVLLGLALGTKAWAVVAVVPVLVAVRGGRGRLLAVAALTGAPLALAMPLADPDAFMRSAKAIADPYLVTQLNWWWPFTHVEHVVFRYGHAALPAGVRRLPLSLTRPELSWLAPVASLVLGGAFLKRRARRSDPAEAVALLALLLLLRATLDPGAILYYHAPVVMALAAWEALAGPRVPVLTLVAMLGMLRGAEVTSVTEMLGAAGGARPAIFVTLSACLAGYVAIRTFRRAAYTDTR